MENDSHVFTMMNLFLLLRCLRRERTASRRLFISHYINDREGLLFSFVHRARRKALVEATTRKAIQQHISPD